MRRRLLVEFTQQLTCDDGSLEAATYLRAICFCLQAGRRLLKDHVSLEAERRRDKVYRLEGLDCSLCRGQGPALLSLQVVG